MIGTEKNERRDWTLLIFIIPIGIILIILVGQLAVRLVPFWRMNTDMTSNLEPDASSARPFALLEPILPQILTPMAWVESYLTPGAEISFPPFLTFEPTFTPSPTSPTPTDLTNTPTTVVTGTPSPTSTAVTGTAVPTDPTDDGGGGTPSPTSTTASPSPTTPSPTATTPSPSPTTPSPTATPTGTPITIPTDVYTEVAPPTQISTVAPDGDVGPGIVDGTYVIINFSGSPIIVLATPDDFYDLVFYEVEDPSNPGYIQFDHIIIGITNDINLGYYEVFHWGDTTPDTNSNANINELPPDPPCASGQECDNYDISVNDLYPTPGTGILIDVDTAPGAPPPNSYNFVVIIAPTTGASGDNAQVDAIVVTEVPTEVPTPTP